MIDDYPILFSIIIILAIFSFITIIRHSQTPLITFIKCAICDKRRIEWQLRRRFNINPFDYAIYASVCSCCAKKTVATKTIDLDHVLVYDKKNNALLRIHAARLPEIILSNKLYKK